MNYQLVKCNKVDNAPVEPLPPQLVALIDQFERAGVLAPTERPDTCCVNVYESGAWLPPHVDSEAFDRPFCTLSLLSAQQAVFGGVLMGLANLVPGVSGGTLILAGWNVRDDSVVPLSPFEHNLDVWRQLWRTLERSDAVCVLADARNPLLHVPAALYEHCAARRLRVVIVLSKVDLVSEAHLCAWRAYLSDRFPAARLADFSSRGREAAASMAGGAGARRKGLRAPLTPAAQTIFAT